MYSPNESPVDRESLFLIPRCKNLKHEVDKIRTCKIRVFTSFRFCLVDHQTQITKYKEAVHFKLGDKEVIPFFFDASSMGYF